jgi:AcrR family transcriptional regulator
VPRRALSAEEQATQRAVRREAVLDGLARCVVAEGYADTTIAQIAAAAGVSKSAVYEHFSDKEDAFLALHAESVEAVDRATQAASDRAASDGLPWREQARAAFAAYFAAMRDGGDRTAAAVLEAASASPRVRAARRAALDAYEAQLGGLVEAIVAREPGATMPDRAARLVMVGGTQDLLARLLEAEGPWDVPALADAQLGLLVRLVGLPA